jgi:hypothetical protein
MAEKKPSKGRKVIPDKVIIDALIKARGLVTIAAKVAGCRYETVRDRIKSSKRVAKAAERAREEQLDLAEGKLLQAVAEGKPWAICFFLKCIGKKRGYIEKQQVEHSGEVTQKWYGREAPIDEV